MGLERLLDKQEVCGSNPHVPTDENKRLAYMAGRFFIRGRPGGFTAESGIGFNPCANRPR